ncbi:MAG: hypothetical protein ABSC31_05980 [Acidimicrobiales bacterium]|jgi:hypothetical protein
MFWRHLPALQEVIAELEQGNGEILVANVSNQILPLNWWATRGSNPAPWD